MINKSRGLAFTTLPWCHATCERTRFIALRYRGLSRAVLAQTDILRCFKLAGDVRRSSVVGVRQVAVTGGGYSVISGNRQCESQWWGLAVWAGFTGGVCNRVVPR